MLSCPCGFEVRTQASKELEKRCVLSFRTPFLVLVYLLFVCEEHLALNLSQSGAGLDDDKTEIQR
jgi:hypothetical protein